MDDFRTVAMLLGQLPISGSITQAVTLVDRMALLEKLQAEMQQQIFMLQESLTIFAAVVEDIHKNIPKSFL